MKIQAMPFAMVDWNSITPVEFKGETGVALWRTFEEGNIRSRVVEYSKGFFADHWCSRGHVLFVIEGELMIRLKDSREFCLKPGNGFCVSDDPGNAHLVYTDGGAKVFIVD